ETGRKMGTSLCRPRRGFSRSHRAKPLQRNLVPVNLYRPSPTIFAISLFVLLFFAGSLKAQTKTWNFDKDTVQSLPQSWLSALTGHGAKEVWVVLQDSTAPSQPNVLAQTSKDITDYRFPVAIVQNASYQDPALSVQFKTISGRVDQSAGLVW